MKKTYTLKELEVPIEVARTSGPFEEFKKDASIVSVKLKSGKIIERVMLLYPNYVISVAEESELSFNPKEVIHIFQEPKSLRCNRESSWVYWYDPNEFGKNT